MKVYWEVRLVGGWHSSRCTPIGDHRRFATVSEAVQAFVQSSGGGTAYRLVREDGLPLFEMWIGSGWCSRPEWQGRAATTGNMADRGIHGKRARGDGAPPEQLPHLGDAGRGTLVWMLALAERLRRVRISCGEWQRILGPSVTEKHGITGVFLDPPYSDDEHTVDYAAGGHVASDVAAWARENGGNPSLRIALCGYEGEHEMPESWTKIEWKARGGYGSQGDGAGRENAGRERIWFSPGCLGRSVRGPLFAEATP